MQLIKQYAHHQEIYNKGFRFNPEEEIFFTTKDTKDFVFPEDERYHEWKIQKIDRDKYLKERTEELGAKPKDYTLELIDENGKGKTPIFTASEFGDLEILQYSLRRKIHTYAAKTTTAGTTFVPRCQTRINPLWADFTEGKYDFSEGMNTPFWAPKMIQAFEDALEVDNLVITEGQIKAFKAVHDGLFCVGLTSISHFRDKKFNSLHPEIIEFIIRCKVKNVTILWDGDCKNISTKDIERGTEATTRPGNFYRYAAAIKKLLQKSFSAKRLSIFFATIKSDEIPDYPKGIDDLFLKLKNEKTAVLNDFANIGTIPGHYIEWINITNDIGVKEMRRYFNLSWVSDFYQAHKDIIKTKNFVFDGTTYRIDKGMPVAEIHKDLKKYMRIGPDYFKLTPQGTYNEDGEKIRDDEFLMPWKKTEIEDDFGKGSAKQILKLAGFCNIPNHTNYKQIVDDKWNLYSYINHDTNPGEWPNIEKFLKHIFEDQYDMGLDYIQLLYTKPYQKLPVLCLVSKEEATGKSLFLNFIYMIFQNNMAFVTPDDILGNWTSHWISKLIVASEETFFDKPVALEKIKSISTADKYMRAERFTTSQMIDCFVHFIFASNHEDNFIKLGKNASRFWVRKIKSIAKQNQDTELAAKLQNELGAFLYHLMNRELVHEKKDRMFFDTELTKTEAFYNIVAHSEPGIIKDLRIQLEDYFLCHRVDRLMVCVKDLKEHFGLTGNDYYLNQALKEYLKAEKQPQDNRYSFFIQNKSDYRKPIEIKAKGRYFTFYAADYVDLKDYKLDFDATNIVPTNEVDSLLEEDDNMPF